MKKNNITYSFIVLGAFIVGLFIGSHININHDMSSNEHNAMNHAMMDPMQMSMADMGSMLQGKTGDDLDKAFLEGMIPHHQGAIDMAQFLINAKHPELKKMGEEIIATQQAEIDQMNAWLVEWGYNK